MKDIEKNLNVSETISSFTVAAREQMIKGSVKRNAIKYKIAAFGLAATLMSGCSLLPEDSPIIDGTTETIETTYDGETKGINELSSEVIDESAELSSEAVDESAELSSEAADEIGTDTETKNEETKVETKAEEKKEETKTEEKKTETKTEIKDNNTNNNVTAGAATQNTESGKTKTLIEDITGGDVISQTKEEKVNTTSTGETTTIIEDNVVNPDLGGGKIAADNKTEEKKIEDIKAETKEETKVETKEETKVETKAEEKKEETKTEVKNEGSVTEIVGGETGSEITTEDKIVLPDIDPALLEELLALQKAQQMVPDGYVEGVDNTNAEGAPTKGSK